jgi:hypothetical protein
MTATTNNSGNSNITNFTKTPNTNNHSTDNNSTTTYTTMAIITTTTGTPSPLHSSPLLLDFARHSQANRSWLGPPVMAGPTPCREASEHTHTLVLRPLNVGESLCDTGVFGFSLALVMTEAEDSWGVADVWFPQACGQQLVRQSRKNVAISGFV